VGVWDELSSLPVRTGEYDQSGALTTSWLPDPTSNTGAPLAENFGGVASWLLSDPLANTTGAITTTGSIVSGTRTLDAFGGERGPATGSACGQGADVSARKRGRRCGSWRGCWRS
jgi:hypothetical protein